MLYGWPFFELECGFRSKLFWEIFPVKADPKTVGNKLSKRLMETKHQLYGDRGIHYAEVCTWYGALRFAELTNNKD